MRKLVFFILLVSIFVLKTSVAFSNSETASKNILLKKYKEEFKSPTANKLYIVADIANLKTREAADFLISLLDTNSYLLKDEVLYQLGKLKEKRAVPKIIKALRHDSTRVRSTALGALGEIKDKGSVKALMEYVKNGGEGTYYAAKALLSMNVKDAIPVILSHINTPGSGISSSIASSIPQDGCTTDFKIKVKELLKDKDSDVKIMAISMLGVLYDKDSAKDISILLKDPDERVRVKAAYVLGDLKDSLTLQDLINSLKDKCASVRMEALYSLALFREANVIPYIEKILFNDGDSSVKIAAVYALGQIRSGNAVKILVKALKFEDSEIQLEVIKSLGYFKDKYEAKRALLSLLYSADKTIRERAKKALKPN